MTIQEIINKVELWCNKHPKNGPYGWADPVELMDSLSIHTEEDLQEIVGLRWVPLRTWICTDVSVGFGAFVLFGDVVAFSFQMGRKCNTDIWWVNDAAAKTTAKEILKYVRPYSLSRADTNLDLKQSMKDVLDTYPEARTTDILK